MQNSTPASIQRSLHSNAANGLTPAVIERQWFFPSPHHPTGLPDLQPQTQHWWLGQPDHPDQNRPPPRSRPSSPRPPPEHHNPLPNPAFLSQEPLWVTEIKSEELKKYRQEAKARHEALGQQPITTESVAKFHQELEELENFMQQQVFQRVKQRLDANDVPSPAPFPSQPNDIRVHAMHGPPPPPPPPIAPSGPPPNFHPNMQAGPGGPPPNGPPMGNKHHEPSPKQGVVRFRGDQSGQRKQLPFTSFCPKESPYWLPARIPVTIEGFVTF